MKKNKDGFSLIELVVVVSVLSILSAIAIQVSFVFQKGQATAALENLKQIKTECALKEAKQNLNFYFKFFRWIYDSI